MTAWKLAPHSSAPHSKMNKLSIPHAARVISARLIVELVTSIICSKHNIKRRSCCELYLYSHRVEVYYLCQPKTQSHARILNTGPARSMATTTKPYKLFHVPTHRVGVYRCQPGAQRHARFRNTGGVTTTNKLFSS